MGMITFNGVSSATYGINIWSAPNYELPEKDQEIYHVPGRSGDLIVDYGSWKNVKRTYTVSLGSDNASFPALARTLSTWLNSAHANGYARLEDSYESDCYRMARFSGGIEIANILDHAAMATISFDCKPQRFLLSGETELTVGNNGQVNNATLFVANPTIKVRGNTSGTRWIQLTSVLNSSISYRVEFSELSTNSDLVINGEMQECYVGTTSKNSTVTMSNGFPKIHPGGMTLTYSGVTSVKVVPNLWVL